MAKRKALTMLVSRADNKMYPPGEMIDISHLTPEEIKLLEDMAAIAPEGSTVNVISELEDVNGIGAEWAKALAANGITTVHQLVAADPLDLESKLGVATPGTLKKWQAAARGHKGGK